MSDSGELYGQLRTHGLQGLKDLVTNRRQEDVLLDFKRKADPLSPVLATSDREHLSKELSAFANSAGGVLVWGIGTGKGEDKNVATDLVPISSLSAFVGNLNSAVGEATRPRVRGIEVSSIEDVPNSNKGFALVHAPESDAAPHRALHHTNQPYYTRIGGNSYVMEHHLLEDMFGSRRRPSLALSINAIGGDVRSGLVQLAIGIRNVGRGAARSPSLELVLNDCSLSDRNGRDDGLPRLRWTPGDPYAWSGGLNDVIHSQATRSVTQVDAWTSKPIASIGFRLFADDMREVAETFLLTADLLKFAWESRGKRLKGISYWEVPDLGAR